MVKLIKTETVESKVPNAFNWEAFLAFQWKRVSYVKYAQKQSLCAILPPVNHGSNEKWIIINFKKTSNSEGSFGFVGEIATNEFWNKH